MNDTRRADARARWSRTLVLAVLVVVAASCGSAEPSSEPAPTSPHSTHHAANGDAIVMKLIAYQPDEVGVPVHSSVTWTQTDAGFHTVTSGTVDKDPSGSVEQHPDGTFASGKLATGKTFAFTFDDAGTYPFFCEIHPATMSGRVRVA